MSDVIRYNLEGSRVHRWLKTMPVYGIPYWQCAVTESVLEYLKGDLHPSTFTCDGGDSIYCNSKVGYSVHFYVTDKMKDQKQLVLQPFNGLCIDEKVEINITIPNPPKDTLICHSFQPVERPKQLFSIFKDGADQDLINTGSRSGCGDIPYNPLPSFKKLIGKLYWKK